MNDSIKNLFFNAKKIVFFTGAGMSTESGVPDFRSPGGIWTKYRPVYFDDFMSDGESRRRYWQMKKETYELYKTVKPNSGHYGILKFEKSHQLLSVITQNIDGLHQLAGLSEDKVIEIHGTDRKVNCTSCWKFFNADPIFSSISPESENFKAPLCPDCGGFLKPATISFGQNMPLDKMCLAEKMAKESDLFVVLGSSLQVQPAATLPVIAKQHGATLIIINRDFTPLDDFANHVIHEEIGKVFSFLFKDL